MEDNIMDQEQAELLSPKEYICKAGDQFNTMVGQKEEMKVIQVSSKRMTEMLGVLFIEKKMITSTQLNAIKNTIEKPTYDYQAPGSVWELYNYITESLVNISPQYWPTAQVNIHQWFIEEFNIEA